MMSWSCRGEEPKYQLVSAKNRIDVLSKLFNWEEYDHYVAEMKENRTEDPNYGATMTWEDWLESRVGDETQLIELDTTAVVF